MPSTEETRTKVRCCCSRTCFERVYCEGLKESESESESESVMLRISSRKSLVFYTVRTASSFALVAASDALHDASPKNRSRACND